MRKWMVVFSIFTFFTAITSAADDDSVKEVGDQTENRWHELHWLAEVRQDHPLVGQLWRVDDETFVTWQGLSGPNLASLRVVVIGRTA